MRFGHLFARRADWFATPPAFWSCAGHEADPRPGRDHADRRGVQRLPRRRRRRVHQRRRRRLRAQGERAANELSVYLDFDQFS